MLSIYTQIAYSSWIVIFIVWSLGHFSVKKTSQRPDIFQQLLINILIVFSFLLLFNPGTQGIVNIRLTPATVQFGIVGVLVDVIGILFAIWARMSLGSNWAGTIMSVKKDHELIQTGAYAVVRHPIYTGFLLGMLGTAMTIGLVGSYVAVCICAVGFLLRIQKEERLMQQEFPEQYPIYKAQTKTLIPFIW